MKKILTAALACCIAMTGFASLTACSGGTDYDHTIIFYSSQGQTLTPVTDKAIAKFEAKYPGWKVEHSQPGGYDEVLDKVRQDLTAGLQPDLAYCYADHVAQYLPSGTVVKMNEYLTNSESYTYEADGQSVTVDRIGFTEDDVNNFIPRFLEEGYARNFTGYESAGLAADDLITLPFVKSTELLYYNVNALKQLREDVPETWDDLWRICRKAQAKWETCTPLGYDSEANWFISTAEQRGFGYTSVDADNHYLFVNEGAAEWLEEIRGLYKEKLITTQQIYGSYTSSLFTKGPENGGLVFCIGSSGGASNQYGDDITTGVAPVPGVYRDADGDGEDEFHGECISQGPSLVMLRGGNGVANTTEKEIMTFQFVKELLDVQFQAQFSTTSGYNPMRSDVYEDEIFANYLLGKDDSGNSLTKGDLVISMSVTAGTQLNDRFFVSPAFVGSSTARAQMTSLVQKALLNQGTIQAALEEAYKNCGGVL